VNKVSQGSVIENARGGIANVKQDLVEGGMPFVAFDQVSQCFRVT